MDSNDNEANLELFLPDSAATKLAILSAAFSLVAGFAIYNFGKIMVEMAFNESRLTRIIEED